MSIHDLPTSSKPRERLFHTGIQSLSDAEILALLFRTGNNKESALQLAQRILKHHPLHLICEHPHHLKQYKGIGIAKLSSFIAACEIHKRAQHIAPNTYITTPLQAATHAQSLLTTPTQEHVIGLYLDTRKRLIHAQLIFKGTLDAIVVHPREIFSYALTLKAAAIIIIHNHPSGDPTPSDEDITFTKQLIQASHMLHIEVCDHIILGHQTYYSMQEHELLG